MTVYYQNIVGTALVPGVAFFFTGNTEKIEAFRINESTSTWINVKFSESAASVNTIGGGDVYPVGAAYIVKANFNTDPGVVFYRKTGLAEYTLLTSDVPAPSDGTWRDAIFTRDGHLAIYGTNAATGDTLRAAVINSDGTIVETPGVFDVDHTAAVGGTFTLAESPNEQYFAITGRGSGQNLGIYERTGLEEFTKITEIDVTDGGNPTGGSVAWSPDSKYLAIMTGSAAQSSVRKIKVYDAEDSFNLEADLSSDHDSGNESDVAIQFSPANDYLFVSGEGTSFFDMDFNLIGSLTDEVALGDNAGFSISPSGTEIIAITTSSSSGKLAAYTVDINAPSVTLATVVDNISDGTGGTCLGFF